MKQRFFGLMIACFAVAGIGASGSPEALAPGLYAQFQTSRGIMVFQLDYENTPLTVANFAGLAKGILRNEVKGSGEPFFDDMPIYKAIKGYALFIGDPSGSGEGGPGYSLPREMTGRISAEASGILVMNGLATESSASQFFITVHGDGFLDSKYTSFGKMVSGEDVLKKLKENDVIKSVQILQIGSVAKSLSLSQSQFDQRLASARETEIDTLESIDVALANTVRELGPNRKKTMTGIHYVVLNNGTGSTPGVGNQVTIHYVGSFVNGQVFDSSKNRGQTFSFTVGQDSLIPGWIEMIIGMKIGEIRKVVMPPEMAYGENGYGPIGPDSWLIYEIELISITEE